jgi:hypothetical protein
MLVAVAVHHAMVVTVAVHHAMAVTVAVATMRAAVTVAVHHAMAVTVAVATMGAAVTDPHGRTGSPLSKMMGLTPGAALILAHLPTVSAYN